MQNKPLVFLFGCPAKTVDASVFEIKVVIYRKLTLFFLAVFLVAFNLFRSKNPNTR